MFHSVVMSSEHKGDNFLCGFEEGDVLLNQPKAKMVGKEKQPRPIVESFHLSMMVANYN
jgi:hypothetical protein